MMRERPICFWLFRHAVRCALALDFANAGSNSAARMPMMAMTTSNSIRVNALRGRMLFFIPMALATQIWTLSVARHLHTICLITSAGEPNAAPQQFVPLVSQEAECASSFQLFV